MPRSPGITEIALGVVLNDGRLLIQPRRRDPLPGGMWELPGGRRKADESLEETAVREVAEETRVTVEAGPLLVALSHRYPDRVVTLYVFLCTPIGEAGARPGVEWVTPAEVRARGFPEANAAVLDALEWELGRGRGKARAGESAGQYDREPSGLDNL